MRAQPQHGRGRLLGLWGIVPSLLLAAPDPATRIEYNRDIRPILSDTCFPGHGPEKNTRKGKLRLDLHASTPPCSGSTTGGLP